MKHTVFNYIKGAFAFSLLSLLFFSCKDEPEEKLEIHDNLPGTWISKKCVELELRSGSTWMYDEVSSHKEGEWLNIPFTFTNNSSYRIEYKESDNYIVKYKSNYVTDGDTILMNQLDSFPCHKACVTFNNRTSMILSICSVNEKGKKIKTEYHFEKEASTRPEHAFQSVAIKHNEEYICSSVNHEYISTIYISSLAESVLLRINNSENITLTGNNPILVINSDVYSAKTKETLTAGDTALFYFDKEKKTLNSTHTDKDIEENSIGEVLFWMIK